MGNYRQHITFAAFLGVGYAWAAFLLAGIHWLYGSVAALLATLSGLLPDLDSDSGVELKSFTGILGVITAVAVWQEIGSGSSRRRSSSFTSGRRLAAYRHGAPRLAPRSCRA